MKGRFNSRMNFRAGALLILICCLPAVRTNAQSSQTGDLSAYVDSYISGLPGAATNVYQTPSIAALATWGRTISSILAGSYASAQSRADSIGYKLIQYTDNGAAPNRTYYVLARKNSSSPYWGMFIYNPSSTRTKLFIQSPHPKYDSNTGTQGFYILKNVNARAFIISGTHRCNNQDSTLCDGTTTACDGGLKYKISDQAHNVAATFQRTTEIMMNTIPNLIIIQPHGFGKDAGDPDLIMSNGTTTTPAVDFLLKLRDKLADIDNSLTFKLAHIDAGWTKLIATVNTQGRLLNGSNDPCYTAASAANGRFLHIEQALTGLRDNTANRKKLSDAIALTFPENSTAASGNWNSPDTWMKGAVPKSTDDVLITEGTTITVTTATDSCRSISFGSDASKISMSSNAVLNVTGDFTLASTAHSAFSSWGSGAKIKFTGSAATQTLAGWNTLGFSTSFNDIVIDKSAGKVTTSGSGMRFSFGNSLLITRGTFELDTADDIETRDITGSATPGAITIESEGILKILGGDSYIRRGANTDTLASRIGKVTVNGKMYLACMNANRLNFGGIDVESGGELQLTTGWTGASGYFNPGTVTVKSGGLLTNYTTQTLWHATAYLVLQNGGMLDVLSSGIGLPALLTINGDVQYSRAGIQTLSSKIQTYNNLILTGTSAKTLAVNTTINGVLAMKGKASLSTGAYSLSYSAGGTLQYASIDTAQTSASAEFPSVNGPAHLVISNPGGVALHAARTLSGSLRLEAGTFNNSGAALTLGNNALVRRNELSQVTSSPVFGTVCNVEYTNASVLTTGFEIPSSAGVLSNLSLTGSGGVLLGSNATVNGQLTLGAASLNTAGYTLSFGTAAASPSETSAARITGIASMLQRPVNTDTLNFLGIALRGSGNAGAITLTRTTGTPVNGSANQSIQAKWNISSTAGSVTGKTAELTWFTALDNGKSFSVLNKAQCWKSTDNESSWETEGELQYPIPEPRALSVPFSGSAVFTVSDSLHPLVPTLYSAVLNEAMWNGQSTIRDTVSAEVRESVSPHALISSSSAVPDTVGKTAFQFSGIQNGTPYYLVIRHRNSISIWSSSTVLFSNGLKGYRFTDAQNSAYGSNTVLKYGKYCLFSGDTNQDGIVDFSDLVAVDNASLNFVTGYVPEDLNGDEFVDFTDLTIADNNSTAFITVITPP